MPTFGDAGYLLARVTITEESTVPSELLLVETGETDTDTRSFTVLGLEALVMIKTVIEDEIEKAAQRAEIAKDIPQ
jgi:hypothetical protein